MARQKKVMKRTSAAQSFTGWEVWEFIKGRKRSVVALLAAGLAYFISDQATTALIAGIVVEAIWGALDFYFTEVEY